MVKVPSKDATKAKPYIYTTATNSTHSKTGTNIM